MITKDTARAIAQAKIDKLNIVRSPSPPVPLKLNSIIWFTRRAITQPFYELRMFFESLRVPDGIVIADAYTREEDFGWVFFYQSQRFLLTGNPAWMLVGTAPLIIDRCDGSVHKTGSYRPIEHFIEEYRVSRSLSC